MYCCPPAVLMHQAAMKVEYFWQNQSSPCTENRDEVKKVKPMFVTFVFINATRTRPLSVEKGRNNLYYIYYIICYPDT